MSIIGHAFVTLVLLPKMIENQVVADYLKVLISACASLIWYTTGALDQPDGLSLPLYSLLALAFHSHQLLQTCVSWAVGDGGKKRV